MGAFLGAPKTNKYNESGSGNDLQYALASMQGWRTSMEDTHCALTRLPGKLKDWSFFAIFDGHAGTSISELCSVELLKSIVDTNEFQKINLNMTPSLSDIKNGIRDGFLSLDERLRFLPNLASGEDKSGSTAVCVLITPEHYFFANCGDSRAILIRNGEVVFSTVDHKPENPSEQTRIINAGGSVIVQRVNGSLAVSRALGDYAFKSVQNLGPTEQLVSPEPEITVLDRNKNEDEIIILACDGIWDVMTNEELCDFFLHRMRCTNDLSAICNELIDFSLFKGSSDNMSVLLVALEPAPQVDTTIQFKDELLDSIIEARMKEFFEIKSPYKITIESALGYIHSFTESKEFDKIAWNSKMGKIQEIINEYRSSCINSTYSRFLNQ